MCAATQSHATGISTTSSAHILTSTARLYKYVYMIQRGMRVACVVPWRHGSDQTRLCTAARLERAQDASGVKCCVGPKSLVLEGERMRKTSPRFTWRADRSETKRASADTGLEKVAFDSSGIYVHFLVRGQQQDTRRWQACAGASAL